MPHRDIMGQCNLQECGIYKSVGARETRNIHLECMNLRDDI